MEEQNITNVSNIMQSVKILKGNTKVAVFCEPLFGIPFVLYNFYLSLYMKELGVTDKEFGYLIFIGFAVGTITALFGGAITDKLGRKRTTLIFDFISWPLALILYLVSHNFWTLVLATIVNNVVKIVEISWNLMVIEDADTAQRVSAFNLLNIINIATGILIPLAGILVNKFGVLTGERIFIAYAAVSMSLMIIIRNHYFKETKMGQQIFEENRNNPIKFDLKSALPLKAAAAFSKNPLAIMIICVYILFYIYIPLGTISSLYFAPYMTEVLKLDKSMISVLGGVYSSVMFIIFLFVIPRISKKNKIINMIVGLVIQALALLLIITIPSGNLFITIACISLFAVGFGVFRPFIDTILAEVTEGKDRAGIYSIINSTACILTAVMGFVSGSIYSFNPKLLYIFSILILTVSIGILILYNKEKTSA